MSAIQTAALTYNKWGTRIETCDASDEHLLAFAFDGTKATAEAEGWQLLPGPAQLVTVTGDISAILWPVVRSAGDSS